MLRALLAVLTVSGCAAAPLPMSVVLPQSVAASDPTILWQHESGPRETEGGRRRRLPSCSRVCPSTPVVADAEVSANLAAQGVLEQHRGADKRYDAETRHGAEQGAVFP